MVAAVLVLISCLSLQLPSVIAVERNIEYATLGCRYELYVWASDSWQIETPLDVMVCLTLIQKGIEDREIEYVTSNSKAWPFLKLEVRAHSEDVTWFLRYYDDFVNLTENGDCWEKQFRLEMPTSADKLGRGESADSTLSAIMRIDEYGANHTLLNSLAIVGGSIMKIDVFRPLLSPTETYVAGGFGKWAY
ncbi:MAG: hypothetical protein JSV35_04850 [Candidatus Bathyarchaeota archaeon]|nr:MAG: hypothetical protein JSV35_04850 [Candidatus Bathyarchaeota archaeon]